MECFDFSGSWIELVMSYVKSLSYSVLMNGKTGEKFIASRRLRQGDSLSPYLFLICAEEFSRLLHFTKQEERIEGVKVCRGRSRFMYLFFVDDSILLGNTCKIQISNTVAD